jgi:hypothetical protein
MNATATHSNTAATAPIAPWLATNGVGRVGPASAGAVVHRVRPAAVLVNPTIAPVSPIAVVVKKSYTQPARVRITLGASGRVRQAATLTRIMTATSGRIRLFSARQGGNEIVFTPSQSNPNESTLTIPANELNRGKVLFAQSDSPSSGLSDYLLRLSLAPGPTAGNPVEVVVVAVSLTLDISPPRTAPGAVLTPLPQPPDPRPAPGTGTDKWFGGLQLNSQDPGNHQQRAELRATIIPSTFVSVLLLRQVVVSGDNIGGLDTRVQVFDSEIPGPSGVPPVPETPLGNNLEIPSADAVFPGKAFFVQGAAGSRTLRDTGFQLGLKDVENDGDRVALSIRVAPVLTVDSPIIVVRQPHTNPARRVMTIRASSAFGRTGTLTRLAGGPALRVFNAAGTEIVDLAAGHVVSAADLSAGVQLSVESTVRSGAANDVQFTLTLAPGGTGSVPVGTAPTLTMTAVELKLDVGLTRPSPGVAPPLMSDADKIRPGRFVQLRTPALTHGRAMIILRPPNPRIVLTVRLESLNTQVEAFGPEEPFAGQSAHPRPSTFPGDLLTIGGNGTELFVEGAAVSTAVLDTGFRYGIDGLENECDRVVFTVLPDPSIAGPFPVGQHEYTRPLPLSIPLMDETISDLTLAESGLPSTAPERKQTTGPISANIHALVRYPATTAGLDSPVSTVFTKYPLIVIAHGNHRVVDSAGTPVESFRGLEYLCSHFASYGYIAISVDLDVVNPGGLFPFPAIVQRGLVILEHIDFWTTTLNAGDPLFTGKLDVPARIGLIGHSRGGEAVVSAQKTNLDASRGFDIKAIASISQTDFLGITHASTPYLVIYGSGDGDVSNGGGFRLYDRAAPFKSLVWVYGAIHNRFSTSPDWLARLDGDPPEPRMISAPDHLNIARGYCLGFMQFVMRSFADHLHLFKDNGRPSAVSAAVEIHHQVEEKPPKLIVDDFEQGAFSPAASRAVQGAQLATRATTNSLNLGVSQSGLAVPSSPLTNDLTEGSLRNRELDFFWNDTFGAILAWDAVGARYTQNLGSRDVSAFKVLSFRVTQRFGSSRNPDPAPPAVGVSPDFSISLGDTNGQNAQVRVGSVATIPFPWKRSQNVRDPITRLVTGTTNRLTKSAFITIRIPLSTFKNVNSALNLNALRLVIFQFNQTAQGEIAIDNLEFSN